MMKGRILQSATVALLLGCAQPSLGRDQFLDRVESGLQMPPGAKPLEQYSRSYFYIEGGKKVMGVLTTLRPPGRHWTDRNPGPFVSDGGCAIVSVIIDAATQRVESVECNGIG
jgi:hypothetical protein